MHGFDPGDDNSRASKRLEPQHRSGYPFDRPVVLLDDVIEVFALAHQDINAGVRFHAFNGRSVRAALVDGDLLRHVVQVDRPLQEAPGSRQIALGGEQKVHRIALAINGPIQIFPFSDEL